MYAAAIAVLKSTNCKRAIESSGVAAETRRAILRYCFVVACRLRSRRRRFRFLFSLFMLFQPLRISPTEVKQKRYSMML